MQNLLLDTGLAVLCIVAAGSDAQNQQHHVVLMSLCRYLQLQLVVNFEGL